MTRAPSIFLVVLLLMLSACATSNTPERQLPSRDRHLITQEEIEAASGSYADTYALVQRLRPLWLNRRYSYGISYASGTGVYLDGFRVGSLSALRGIHPDNIATLRFLSAGQAAIRLGSRDRYGAIAITTRSR